MKCPGQDTRYWKPGDIFETTCPECGRAVEFFKDESARRCRGCRAMVVNPKMDFGCAAYCKYALECLGQMGPELLAKRADLLKDRVALEVKRRLGRAFQTISHAMKVARHAEELAREEKAEPAVVLCAAFLHVFSEGLPGDRAAPGQGQEAREIIEALGGDEELITKVEGIIEAFGRGRADGTINTKVFFDAHLLAAAEEGADRRAGSVGAERAAEPFLTEAGRARASRPASGTRKAS